VRNGRHIVVITVINATGEPESKWTRQLWSMSQEYHQDLYHCDGMWYVIVMGIDRMRDVVAATISEVLGK
jgi:hypothetical protein